MRSPQAAKRIAWEGAVTTTIMKISSRNLPLFAAAAW